MLLRQAVCLEGIPRQVVVNFIASDLLLRRLRGSQATNRALALRLQAVMPGPDIFADLSGRALVIFRFQFTMMYGRFMVSQGRRPGDEEVILLAHTARTVALNQ